MIVNIRKKLCQQFCQYYKPSKKNELACKGLIVVETLIKTGKKIPFDKIRKKLNATTEENLIQNICIVCPFFKDDCDFVSTPPLPHFSKGRQRGVRDTKKSSPCGGFVLLGHLLERNIISIDDIKNII